MRRALLFLFFVTGGTALGYQIVWARMLANKLGHEMPAVIAVVSAFMAAMALGAWLFSGPIQRSARPGWWYAGLEMFIGLAAFAAGKAPLLLLPAFIAMGASFPAMERFVRPMAPNGRFVGGLYACNTAGAVAGIVAVTWWMMPALGLRHTAFALGALNLIAGIIAWVIAQKRFEATVSGETLERRLVASVFVTGLLAIGYEIVGVRVLAQVIENTVYSYAAVLAVYLLGTSLGAAIYQRFGREQWLSELLGGTAVVCLGGIMVMSKAQIIYNWLRSGFGDSTAGVLGAEMLLAAGVFLLPAMMMGAIFSLMMQRGVWRLSKLLAVNTLGSALAPLLFAVVLLPRIGSKWVLVMISFAYFALVSRGSGAASPRAFSWRPWLMPLVAVGMVLLLPNLQFVQVPPGGSIIDYREGVMASVAVVRDAAGDRTLKVNNRFQMGGTSAASTEYRQAHLPLLLHPKPRRALFLGTGTGITFGAASLYPDLEADGVELVPEIVELMRHFKPHNFLDDYGNRLRIHVADARRFVKTTRHLYDVIVADLFHPARDGAGTLYTKEHFRAIRARLNAGGIFCQWLPLHQMDETMLRVVIRTFLEVFPKSQAYLLHWSVDVPVLGLMGADSSPSYVDPLRTEPLHSHLKRLALADSARLSGNFVAGAEALRRFAADAPINTDDHQIVTYAAPRFSYQRHATPYGRLLTVLGIEGPPTDFIRARNVYLNGLVHETEGRLPKAIEYYIESARISDDFTLGYSRCITLASSQASDHPEAARALLQRLVDAKPQERLARELLERLFPAPQK